MIGVADAAMAVRLIGRQSPVCLSPVAQTWFGGVNIESSETLWVHWKRLSERQ